MNITYFQDTLFRTDDALTAPATAAALQVASTNTFKTSNYTLIVTVANINTNVKVLLEGSIDAVNYAPIIAEQTISGNGTVVYSVANRPVKWIRPKFTEENGGVAALVTFSIAAS